MFHLISNMICTLQESVHDLQVEIQKLTQERDDLKAVADDRDHLQSIVADLQAKLCDTESRLQEQTSTVCFPFFRQSWAVCNAE